MRNKQNNFTRRGVAALLAILIVAGANFAQTTVFTYQGRLTDAGAAATGVYDLQFKLYDAAGNQVGAAQIKEDVNVSNGAFTVSLDAAQFAANAFDGSERALEIAVRRGTETGAFTVLSPRQPVTSTPYAIRARNAGAVETTTAGNSVVSSINNQATGATINSDRLAADVVRLKPAASQTSTTTDGNAPLLDLTGAVTDGSANPPATARFRLNHNGAFGIFRDAANSSDPIIQLDRSAGFLVRGAFDGGASGFGIPFEGEGTRMMWYPGKAAFRAGFVNGTQWDAANTGNYSTAFGLNSRASGDYSFAAGHSVRADNVSSVALGEGVTATGAASVALGYGAHTNARQGSFVFADRSVPLVYDSFGNIDFTASDNNGSIIRAGVNHSATWRVSGGFRIFTSSNQSTGVTIQSGAAVSNWGQANAVISTSTGALLSTGGVWTNASSRDLKTNFARVDPRAILQKVLRLPIQTWSYKSEAATVRHIGAVAQDFKQTFDFGGTDQGIGTVDADGVALAAIQGVHEELKLRDRKIEDQQRQIDELKAVVCAIKPDAAACAKSKK